MAYDSGFSRFSSSPDPEGRDRFEVFHYNNDQSILDQNLAHRAIDEDGRILEMAVESSDHLDGLRIALEDSNRVNDLLTQSAYNILRKQLKAISKQNKVAYDDLPAMESMDHMSKRELSMAMENVVTETIKGIWQKIRDTFIGLHNKIKDWYIKAWDGAALLKKQAEGMKARVDSMGSSPPKEAAFEMQGLKALNIAGKVPSVAEVVKGVQDIYAITVAALSKNPETYTKLFPNLEQSLKETVEAAKTMAGSTNEKDDKGADKATIGNSFGGTAGEELGATSTSSSNVATGKINKVIEQLFKDFKTAAKSLGIPDNGKGLESDERFNKNITVTMRRSPTVYLGNCMIVGSFPATLETGNVISPEMYNVLRDAFKVQITPIEAKPREFDDKATFSTASVTEISAICDSVIQSCDIFVAYRLMYESRDKATGSLMKQMDQLVNSQGNLSGPGQTHVKNTVNTTVKIMKNLNDWETQWSRYSMQVLNKAMIYCRNSIAQY